MYHVCINIYFQSVWEELEHTAAISNSGSFSVNSADVQCGSGQSELTECRNFDVGVIEVSVHRDDPDPPRTLTSEMLPLAWYLKTQLLDEHGDEWAKAKCKEWYDLEKRYENI